MSTYAAPRRASRALANSRSAGVFERAATRTTPVRSIGSRDGGLRSYVPVVAKAPRGRPPGRRGRRPRRSTPGTARTRGRRATRRSPRHRRRRRTRRARRTNQSSRPRRLRRLPPRTSATTPPAVRAWSPPRTAGNTRAGSTPWRARACARWGASERSARPECAQARQASARTGTPPKGARTSRIARGGLVFRPPRHPQPAGPPSSPRTAASTSTRGHRNRSSSRFRRARHVDIADALSREGLLRRRACRGSVITGSGRCCVFRGGVSLKKRSNPPRQRRFAGDLLLRVALARALHSRATAS